MNISPRYIIFGAGLALSSLALSGCQTAGGSRTTAYVLSGIGNTLFPGNNIVNFALQASAVGFFQASIQQQAEAEQKARLALRDTTFRKRVQASGRRYVAVGVRKSEGQNVKSSNVVMIYDTKEEKVIKDAYAPQQSSYKKGEDVKFGGLNAVVATSFSGI